MHGTLILAMLLIAACGSFLTPTPTEAPAQVAVAVEVAIPTPTSTTVPPTPTSMLAAPTPTAAASVPAGAIAAQLLNVVDGDTIEVLIDGRSYRVRYIGVDTPERNQPGYAAATEANRALLGDGYLYLVKDVSDVDANGRLLRYVYTASGTFINAELVAQGWAQPVEYPPDIRHAPKFRRLAIEAAQAGRGFWSGNGSDGAMSYALTTVAANIHRGPGTEFEISGKVTANTPLTVFGRNQAGDWLQVRAPNRGGGWIYAPLVTLNVPTASIPVASNIPVPSIATSVPSVTTLDPSVGATDPAPMSGEFAGQIVLFIIENYRTFEILGIRNEGDTPLDISGWRLDGSRGDDYCIIPDGAVLQPGEIYQVATGDSMLTANGFKCGSKPIWNNQEEIIYLRAPNGSIVHQIETR
jgi:endonuclease YncB( thermonuclease family)